MSLIEYAKIRGSGIGLLAAPSAAWGLAAGLILWAISGVAAWLVVLPIGGAVTAVITQTFLRRAVAWLLKELPWFFGVFISLPYVALYWGLVVPGEIVGLRMGWLARMDDDRR